MQIKEIIRTQKQLIPVVVLDDAAHALPLSAAIMEAGGNFIEITLRTQAAIPAIEAIKEHYPDMIVGAGTVLTKDDADRAIKAGADFLVSPGFSPHIVDYVAEQGQLIIPGTITPSEVQLAMHHGLDMLKFFPAEQAGGASMIKAFGSVYPNLSIMPTGGINAQNLTQYAALKNVVAIGGSWVCTADLLKKGEFTQITSLLKEANIIIQNNC